MSSLLVISSAPATILKRGIYLDIKFVEGMRQYSSMWDGDVCCILRASEDTFLFGQQYDQGDLPFKVIVLPADSSIGAEDLCGHDIVLCSGDNHEYLGLAEVAQRAGTKLVYIIENIPETRRKIISLDPSRALISKLYGALWAMAQEIRRRKAFRRADGIQANGYPAHAHYSSLNRNLIMYLDNRVRSELLATTDEIEGRTERLLAGAPLRLLHSGRLEYLKGSQDLIPIARRLASKGVDFVLDIFGTGSLEAEIRKSISKYGLGEKVKLHGAVDFERELVPFARQHADIYLSCHRQSDPSCTYIENMGCGLAVIGFANRMWSSLCRESKAGWVAPLGDTDALAGAVLDASNDRQLLVDSCRAARRFAGEHNFESEYRKRIEHLKDLVLD